MCVSADGNYRLFCSQFTLILTVNSTNTYRLSLSYFEHFSYILFAEKHFPKKRRKISSLNQTKIYRQIYYVYKYISRS